MYSTVSDVITSALRICGVIAKSETPSSDEMNDSLQALNLMLEQWSARRLIVRGTVQYNHALIAGQGSYTIGAGGNFPTAKPIAVTSAFVRDSSGVDTDLDIVSRAEYDSYGDKVLALSRPVSLCYDAGLAQQTVQTGTCLFYPIPDSSTTYTVYMQIQAALTDFTAITDTVTFEAKYGEAIKYELAKRLWREYHESGRPIPGDILVQADKAMCVIEKTNHVLPRASMEVPPRKSIFNIYTGDYN